MAKMAKDSEVPDTVLPVQFFTRTAVADSPEKRLIFAVLMDAIAQLQRGDAQGVLDAERWIRDETGNVPIRFPDACDALGLEAGGLADGLMQWRIHYRCVPRTRHRVAAIGRLRSRGKAPASPAPMSAG